MDTPTTQDMYQIGGMNVDVNPFQQRDQDCNLIQNFYSHKYLAKKVRFGYTQFLNNPDSSPIRNLIFYQFPGKTGLLRVSGGHTYLTTTQTGTWGSPLSGLDWSSDVRLGTAQLSGSVDYVHMSNKVDGYKTWDGTTAKSWTGPFTPKASYLTAYQSRIFADVNQLAVAESAVGFDFQANPLNFPGNGTLALTNGSASIVGTDTVFSTQLISGSQVFVTDSTTQSSYTLTVDVISDDTHMTVTTTYAGTTASGITFNYSWSAVDPFYYDTTSANPAQGGFDPLDAGNNGAIVGLTTVNNTVVIYKQSGIYRYDGTNFINLNFYNSVIPGSIITNDYFRTDYFLSYNSIWVNDAQTIAPASFGVNLIIQATFNTLGVINPISFSFDYLSFFWFGSLVVDGKTLTNAMFVKDERFNEWYIWTIGHTITAFGSYTDQNNVRHMVTGDDQGNTYVWGEQYTNDNGTPINYRIRTRYADYGTPSGSKVPQPQIVVSADLAQEANLLVARNFSNEYKQIGTASGYFSKFSAIGGAFPDYKNLSIEMAGSTMTQRPEFYGWTTAFDEEERFSDSQTSRQSTGR